ncbi:MAG: LysR family transcriptional regulator [Hydrogenophaga sp.]|uniref:winged helix-turn-helix domain-containing protein n=1 Tax=Hydrogenophaga sp. TaxID=1904254 RepID=UPI0027F3F46C|nr:LysR family transcriptional regulator [Hydrogenophaga sp.]
MTGPVRTHFSEALGHTPSDKRLEVLRRVAETGSISLAARDAGISHKAAWQAIDTLSNLSGQTLVERTVGGGARTTPKALQPLARCCVESSSP